jgi:hypothetical protein
MPEMMGYCSNFLNDFKSSIASGVNSISYIRDIIVHFALGDKKPPVFVVFAQVIL